MTIMSAPPIMPIWRTVIKSKAFAMPRSQPSRKSMPILKTKTMASQRTTSPIIDQPTR